MNELQVTLDYQKGCIVHDIEISVPYYFIATRGKEADIYSLEHLFQIALGRRVAECDLEYLSGKYRSIVKVYLNSVLRELSQISQHWERSMVIMNIQSSILRQRIAEICGFDRRCTYLKLANKEI
ncbi:hypothetical protein [Streptococcus merionis]|uniref:hypothetical protein n=1 Tax=Streptococcus merionis TaxID=400065 RepID=UPI003518353E